MSGRYKFKLTSYSNDDKITWELTSRNGAVWNGYFSVGEVLPDNRIAFDFMTTDPANTPIPQKGINLIKYNLRKLVYKAIRTELKNLNSDC